MGLAGVGLLLLGFALTMVRGWGSTRAWCHFCRSTDTLLETQEYSALPLGSYCCWRHVRCGPWWSASEKPRQLGRTPGGHGTDHSLGRSVKGLLKQPTRTYGADWYSSLSVTRSESPVRPLMIGPFSPPRVEFPPGVERPALLLLDWPGFTDEGGWNLNAE